MAKSILQKDKECFVCVHNLVEPSYGENRNYHILECHHVFFGTANRALSEEHGLKLWLCQEHHRGDTGAHRNRTLDLLLKEIAQRKFEEVNKGTYNRSDFIRIFGKSYL